MKEEENNISEKFDLIWKNYRRFQKRLILLVLLIVMPFLFLKPSLEMVGILCLISIFLFVIISQIYSVRKVRCPKCGHYPLLSRFFNFSISFHFFGKCGYCKTDLFNKSKKDS
jgi:hypothetical protein